MSVSLVSFSHMGDQCASLPLRVPVGVAAVLHGKVCAPTLLEVGDVRVLEDVAVVGADASGAPGPDMDVAGRDIVIAAVGLEVADQGPHLADAVRRPAAAGVALGQHGTVLGYGGHFRIAVALLVPDGVGQVHDLAVHELRCLGGGHGGGLGDRSQGCRDEDYGGLHFGE